MLHKLLQFPLLKYSFTNMNKISIFPQFESHSSKSFKVRAIGDLRDLYGNKIQGLTRLDSNFFNLHD